MELTVNQKSVDLTAITESWLENSMADSELNISGYTIFRKDRRLERNAKGGGVLLYVRDCLNAHYATELNDMHNESLWVKIQLSSTRNILDGICYKSPTASECEIKACIKQ